jgi:hypothetical protein
MTTSQNGWPASPNKSAIGIVDATVPGTDVVFPQGVKDGDVKTVLMYVADQFNKTVEPLKAGDCWGYYYRNIQGSTTVSNHASGTAIDLNAPAHPMGKAGTFSATQTAAISNIIRYCEGVVRWGGNYSARKDEMHFEINADAAAVARVAAKIAEHGDHTLLAIDGVLGSNTIARWQQIMGTPVDGVIDHPSELVSAVQKHLKGTVDRALVVDGEGINQDGKHTITAEWLQRYLKTPVDGVISTPISEVVKAVQRRLNTGKF